MLHEPATGAPPPPAPTHTPPFRQPIWESAPLVLLPQAWPAAGPHAAAACPAGLQPGAPTRAALWPPTTDLSNLLLLCCRDAGDMVLLGPGSYTVAAAALEAAAQVHVEGLGQERADEVGVPGGGRAQGPVGSTLCWVGEGVWGPCGQLGFSRPRLGPVQPATQRAASNPAGALLLTHAATPWAPRCG